MNFISTTKPEGENNVAEIRFSIDNATFQEEVTKVFKKRAAKISVPGFRPGKAPRHVIEKMYGKGVFYEDAINNILPTAYPEAVAASGLSIVGAPEIDIEAIDDNGVTVVAKVTLRPELTVTEYKGLTASYKAEKATEEEIEAELNRVRERQGRQIEVTDRAAANGDTATIDYSGSVDGVKFEGGTAEDQPLKLGSGTFIPGFEDQVVGHNVGETFDVNVTFPTEYHAEELAGKAAVFVVTIKKLEMTELPELDDEFAKDVSEFDTLAEYKNEIKAKIQKGKDDAADQEVENQLIEALIAKIEGEIPEAMYAEETENMVRDYDNRLRMQGLDLKTYFKYTGLDLDALRRQFRPQAEKQIRLRLGLEAIAKTEELVPTEEAVAAEFEKLATAYSLELDKVKELVPVEEIKGDLKTRMAMELVKANAKITKKTTRAKKAKAEKPAEEATEAAEQ
ncbi:MAG: trigger factor [Ruminococcaceae bacterium]|nr:trigger factor [Oscillospiraceae bacterium]